MKRLLTLLLVIISFNVFAGFKDFFEDKTLRLDYYHSGDKNNEYYSIDQLIMEPYWGGSKVNLIDIFDYGKYKFEVFDLTYDSIIYSRTYCTLFSEWQTTDEAAITVKSFSETVVFPFPKHNVRIDFYSRNNKNTWDKKFEYTVNPHNKFITSEHRLEFPKFEVHHSGDPATCVDIVILPEGYTKEQMDKFKEDCKKYSEYLFDCRPYKQYKKKFNIWGVEAPSTESGTDYPGDGTWRKTILNSSFYTFDTERYLMTSDNKSVRDLAANAPYDQIYIMVNSDHYGGGAIYNHYAVCIADNSNGEYVFTHELGHAFAGLGDEYYDSQTSYNDFYPLNREPWEPNLTTRVNFDSKWKNLIDKDTPVPTPNESEFKGKIGLFEGGGYVTKGVFRPAYDCTMKSISKDNFCRVCTLAIEKMIDLYTH
jgi:hypothetical protein